LKENIEEKEELETKDEIYHKEVEEEDI